MTSRDLRTTRAVVVVADDDALVRTIIGRVVLSAGLTPLVVGDGLAALQVIRQQSGIVAGAVLDVMLPKMNGIDVVKRLQAEDLRVPIVLVSGGMPPSLLAELEQLRDVTFVPKPFTIQELKKPLQAMHNATL